MKRRFLIGIASILLILTCTVLSINASDFVIAYAHNCQLDVTYDSCVPVNYSSSDLGDGENEKWYELVHNNTCMHFPHNSYETTTIEYHISYVSRDGQIEWDDDPLLVNSVRSSIEKWNNVYFYRQLGNGLVSKHKLVNVNEVTTSNCDLTIYPYFPSIGELGSAQPIVSSGVDIYDGNNVFHIHYSKWLIEINVGDLSSYHLQATAAHELGHVLGLSDIDACENGDNTSNYHHEELLMGYKNNNALARQTEITYKDLVGVAITRGYHTDNDHMWMYDSNSSTIGNFKFICSICNGVKYLSTLPLNNNFVMLKACNDNHSLSSGNMFAVASYNNKDYYKCKYCRYVALFTDNVQQNYVKTYNNQINHLVTNQVTGLSYSFYEPHSLNIYNNCVGCGTHIHVYNDHYALYSADYHKAYCACGDYDLKPHAVRPSTTFVSNGHLFGYCVDCGALVDLGTGPSIIEGLTAIMVTDNGSFISPNGIYVIVDEDLEAYFAGTLVFYPNNQNNI